MRARHRTYCCLSTELPSSLPATRARPALSFFLCERPLLALVCSNQTTFLKRRHCRFGFLSLSLYPPPLFFCFYRVLEGTYLASVRICPFQCEKADDDDSRKVGWWAWTRTRARTFLHTHTCTHTHILLLFFLICREQNSRGSKRPKARRGILIRMLGGPLLYRPRTSSAVVVSNKQQEQSLAGMSEAGGRGQGRRTHRFCPGLYCSPLPPTLELALSPPPHPIFRPFDIPA